MSRDASGEPAGPTGSTEPRGPRNPVDPRARPRAIYVERLAARRARRALLDGRDRTIANLRGLTFVATAALAWMGLARGWVPGWSALVPAALFVALVILHGVVLAARARVDRAIALLELGIGRIDEKAPPGDGGAGLAPAGHPYARDLDLFGPGALFAFLSSARTRPGEERLAAWLLAPATVEEARGRQAAVAELKERVDLREELALYGDDVRADVDAAALASWGEGAAPSPMSGAASVALAALSAATVGATAWWWGFGGPPLPSVIGIALVALVHRLLRDRVRAATRAVDASEAALSIVGAVIARARREPVASPRLVALRRALDGAPEAIAELERLVRLLGWMRNQVFAPVGALLFWGPQLARRIAAWRWRHGGRIRLWLDALADLEALLSLSTYAFERPEETPPELLDGDAPVVRAEGLAHPLLPRATAVRNDVALGGDAPSLLVVSGSNMSGKSTLLRAVGINVVLALAGAPVRARNFRLSRVQLGASIRAEDSLADGVSRFYAEVRRLRQIADLAAAAPPPLLFLADELLAGTNSHDRRIGAAAVVGALVRRGALGLVTTHDLALAELAEQLGGANVHFEDLVTDDPSPEAALRFDYTLRPGPIDPRRTNALRLMRAVGLPTE